MTTQKIGVAVLGIGSMGGGHVQAFRSSPWVERVVGYEPTAERAKERGQELGIPATTDLESLLHNPQIHLITIASPNDTHCELTLRALRAGKSVLCEKPMGISLTEAQLMLAAERETGRFLQIGFECRYSKLYQMVKDWIGAGLIGQPLNSHCDYLCSEFLLRDSWRSKSPSGLIAEKLCHYLDLPRWWFEQPVVELYSQAAPNFVSYFNYSDNHNILYRFANGATSSLNFVMATAETFHGDPLRDMLDQQWDDGHRLVYLIYGTKGAIETDVFRRRIRRWEFTDKPDKLHSKIVETVTFPSSADELWFHNAPGQNIRISQLVAEGCLPELTATDSYESMKMVFAAELSEREHRIVKLNELD